MIKILLDEKLSIMQMYKLLDLLGDIKRFSVEEEYKGKLSKKEIQEVQKELAEYYRKEDCARRKAYDSEEFDYKEQLERLLGIKRKEEAEEYFDELADQEKEVLEDVDFVIGKHEIPKEICELEEFLYQRITRIGAASVGGLYIIYFFKKGKLYEKLIAQMNNIFFGFVIGKKKYKNIILYGENQQVLKILTEQEELILNINEVQLEKLKKLEIGYEVMEG